MPPTTQQILDGLEAMQDADIPKGYKSIAKSAYDEIERLRAMLRMSKYTGRRRS
jgi:hypothetical protein